MKRFLMTIAFTVAFSASVLAGDVPTVGVHAPQQDVPPAITTPGDIPSVGFTKEMTETALSLIQLTLGEVL